MDHLFDSTATAQISFLQDKLGLLILMQCLKWRLYAIDIERISINILGDAKVFNHPSKSLCALHLTSCEGTLVERYMIDPSLILLLLHNSYLVVYCNCFIWRTPISLPITKWCTRIVVSYNITVNPPYSVISVYYLLDY
jgi:hypothetical protein